MKFLVAAKAKEDALSICQRINGLFKDIGLHTMIGDEIYTASFPSDCECALIFTDDLPIETVYDIAGRFMHGMSLFLTHSDKLVIDTKKIHMGYILHMPFNNEELLLAIQIVYFVAKSSFRHINARMFGRFELVVDGKTVHFSNRKAKELLALCIDHQGGEVSIEEATDKLWEDRAYDQQVKNLYRKAVMSLHATLKEAGAEGLLINGRGYCCVDTKMFTCDYYSFLAGGSDGMKAYVQNRTYLFDYSWAEEARTNCEELYMKLAK